MSAVTRPARQRDADGAVDQMAHLGRRRGLCNKGAGHVLEHRDEIEFLLVVPAERSCAPAGRRSASTGMWSRRAS